MILIDKKCGVMRGDAPDCHDGTVIPNTGAAWVDVVGAAVDAVELATFCGSPGGAFLEMAADTL